MKNIFRTSALACVALGLVLSLSASPAQARTNNRIYVKDAQIRLTNLGYPVGHIDGVLGRSTKNAIMAFQRQNALPVSGRLTAETYSLLAQERSVGVGTTTYAPYEDYYRAAGYNYHYNNSYYDNAAANHVVVDGPRYVWANRWQNIRDQELPLRFARLNVHEEDEGSLRHYTVTLNGQPILFADNQPGVLRASQTYSLYNEDAVIFTAYRGGGECPNKSYLLTIRNDGTFNQPFEIGNCAGNYEAHVSDNALLVNFPGIDLTGGWQTWGTWRYENNAMTRI